MQGYLKLKQTDEELYELEIKQNSKIVKYILQIYLQFIVLIKKFFHIITVKEIYSGLIFILPISKIDEEAKRIKQYNRKLKIYIPKIRKLMIRYKISNLVISEELKENKTFLQKFQHDGILEKKIHILEGKGMMQYLIKEIVEYILQKQDRTIELEDLYILVNKDDDYYKQNIAFLSQYFKTINIVTPCLNNYQKFASKLEEQYNTIITVTNNKKKSLRKAKWIVNFDLSKEEMKKYTIYRTATIIYIETNDVYTESAFDGLHICRAGIDVSNEFKETFIKNYLLQQNSLTILYESSITRKRDFSNIKKQMKKDELKIKKLYGSRGIIEESEYKKVS